MNRLRRAVGIPAMAGLMLAGTLPAVAEQPAEAGRKPAELNSTGIPARYANQALDWHPCTSDELPSPPPPGAEGIECATFATPRNWDRPDDRIDLTIAVSRLRATGGEATASVLTNPGGPGAPGRGFPARLRNQHKLREHQDIIGFDSRGTGKSSNITCGGAIGTGSSLDPRDRDRPNLNLILDATRYTAHSCQVKSGELGPLINTYQTVRDIDLLRVLLGRDRINWVGYSAGTWMGAHYATTFPERTGRFVLDSATEFTTRWQKSFDWQPMGFERRWRQDFLPWMAKYDSVYHFGTTGEEARQSYERLRAALGVRPVELDGERVGPNELDSQIAGALYNKRAFPGLAETLVNLRTLVEGYATAEQRAAAAERVRAANVSDSGVTGPQPLRVPTDYDDAFDASFWTIPCNEGPWFGNRSSVVRQSERLGRQYPLLGWGWLIQPCVFWKHKPIELPVVDGRGVPPVLIVQSVHDPATPIEGARRAHRAFANSRMLTITDEGDHGIYAGGNACADDVVERFLVDGVVPDDTSCPGMPLPVPPGA
ncbi:alpha/beta hydrolase fold [Amycolatopsis arida]|uniref:Alpha/beta hydrolase fold n=1 Tax=Amycolatopsis arida TaxID=587909 RepID=A0A1I5TCC2_9PSEU|nr:alpha/beta hydrolase [Amycolatopsis arida]TDX96147.1 alpha/beta hydrolase family protein [Amycolatopsis arida]SFP80662.1 alpha/beta hydrolase fold [Amycolatopsis arida]